MQVFEPVVVERLPAVAEASRNPSSPIDRQATCLAQLMFLNHARQDFDTSQLLLLACSQGDKYAHKCLCSLWHLLIEHAIDKQDMQLQNVITDTYHGMCHSCECGHKSLPQAK